MSQLISGGNHTYVEIQTRQVKKFMSCWSSGIQPILCAMAVHSSECDVIGIKAECMILVLQFVKFVTIKINPFCLRTSNQISS